MAVRFDADGERLIRSGGIGLTSDTHPLTLCGWVKRVTDRNTFSGMMCVASVGTDAAADGEQITTDSGGDNATRTSMAGQGAIAGPSPLTANSWFFVAVTLASGTNNRKGYHKAENAGSMTATATSTPTAGQHDSLTHLWVGDVPFSGEWFNGSVCCVRLWNAVLSSAELLTEAGEPQAVRTSGLQGDWRLSTISDLNDASGNARHLTSPGGAATDTDEPDDIAATGVNITPATVAGVATIPAPTISVGSVVTPATVAGVGSIPAPVLTSSVDIVPATVLGAVTIPAVTIDVAGNINITPVTVQGIVSIPAPVLNSNVDIAPPTVQGVAAISAPSLNSSVGISPPTVQGAANIPAPALSSSAGVTPNTVQGVVDIPAPSLFTDVSVNIFLETVQGVVSIPNPTVIADIVNRWNMHSDMYTETTWTRSEDDSP